MGKVLVAIGSIWLVGVIIAVAFSRLSFVVMLPHRISQRQARFIITATTLTLALGWLIPLCAGLVMIGTRSY